ncbi:MAG: DUF169 domain-containing protein [Deltaproteobacteria bacterium]|nr:DUF169 domain-containing protein [Deltaproteobacteria bacterium]
MESSIARELRTQYPPVALLWSDERPDGCVQFQEGRWGCVIWHLSAAAKGRTAAVDASTYGCLGGATGLGFGNAYEKWPGGIGCFYGFLSDGFDEPAEPGDQDSVHAKRAALHRDGERYVKTPELVEKFVRGLPMMQIPKRYVIFKPLTQVAAEETPQVVVFLVQPDQLSALIVLSNYDRGDNENMIVPFAAACQQIGIYPYREAQSPRPRAVLGLSDISARKWVKRQLGDNLMTVAVPWKRYLELEANVEGSFLQTEQWKALIG